MIAIQSSPSRRHVSEKIDDLFSGMSNVFDIAYDTLIATFNEPSKDHDEQVEKVLWVCRQANLKLNKYKCLFRCTSLPSFGEVVSQQDVDLHARKIQALTDMPLLKLKKSYHHFWVY